MPARIVGTFLFALTVMAATALPASAAQTSFTDGGNDAYRAPGVPLEPPPSQPPNPLLSDPKADILRVTFSNVTTSGANRRSYTVSMSITGPADADYSYVAGGDFGAGCQLYHFLTPGITSKANAFCGSGDSRRLVDVISGSAVTLNGTTLSATYTYSVRKLSPELSADRTLGPLFAFTCVSGLEGLGCRPEEKLDTARSVKTFAI
jgi:hypothetical protein